MTPRTFFTIIIKILGIYLVISGFILIPQLVTTLYSFGRQITYSDFGEMLVLGFFLLFATGVYVMILRYCLFKTDWIIDKLHLDIGFTEEKFEINLHRSTVLKIAVIVIGALIVIDALPQFVKQVFSYFELTNRITSFKQNPASGWMVYHFVKLFIGLFLMTASRMVVNFIELKRKG